MTYPIPGRPITTPYRKVSTGSWKACGWHTGVDFAAPAGTAISAVISGTIRHRDYGSAFGGHQFAISPSAGQPFADEEAFYAHTSERLPDGTEVQAGDYVSRVGYEGNVVPAGPAGAHLHLERHSVKGRWECVVMLDPQAMLDSGPNGPGLVPKYTDTIYSDMLGYDQPPEGYPGGYSASIQELQHRLNQTSLVGGATIPETGSYWHATDREVRLWQEQIAHDVPDPERQSFLGVAQRARMFPPPYVIVDRGLPPIAAGPPEPPPVIVPPDPVVPEPPPAPSVLAPGAEWDPIAEDGGGFFEGLRPFTGDARKITLHTTETSVKPNWEAQQTGIPHFTVDLMTGKVWQHLPLDRAAYTLKGGADDAHSPNSAAGDPHIQIEIIGYTENAPLWTDAEFDNLGSLLGWLSTTFGIPFEYPLSFKNPKRPDWDTYAALSGILGHCHAPPPNDHPDITGLPVERIPEPEVPDPDNLWLRMLAKFVMENYAPILIIVIAALFAWALIAVV